MFIGRHDVSVDPKGRIHLPAKVRDVLLNIYEPPLIVTVSDRRLAGYPAKQWLGKYEQLEAGPYSPEKDDLLRAIAENAEEVPIKNGRILIPARLREYAGIERDAVIVGRIRNIEIWSAERHKEISAKLESGELSQQLRELGF
ncbi:Cell division protein MraZ [hydrothermal vent metagenome]|uniref:Transcriptional regulator MraZ n=1 Tax=hydrothermal vent metagenome TaxID=652676 RepID=A0A3B1C0G6_9ZZZZ